MAGEGTATFETAISSCGCGWFNVFFIMAMFFSCCGMLFDSTSVGLILKSAECDLELSMYMKGVLNAMLYAGMLTAAVPWGFAADIFGRKPILIAGHFLDFLFVIGAGLSQNAVSLCIFKFLNGLVICGPFGTLMSYSSEFHSTRHRSMIIMVTGVVIAISIIILPCLAYVMLPMSYRYQSSFITLNNWNFFLLATSLASLLSVIAFSILPESPKYLMAKGRGDEALKVFSMIYRLNKCKKKSEYPFNKLEDDIPGLSEENKKNDEEKQTRCQRIRETVKRGVNDMKYLCKKQYICKSIMACLVELCIHLCLNGVRLWLPTIFASSDELRRRGNPNPSLCQIIDYNVQQSRTTKAVVRNCTNRSIPAQALINNIIVATVCFVGYLLMIVFVKYVGTYITSILSICCTFACTVFLYFTFNPNMILAGASLFICFVGIAATCVVTFTLEHFPTSIRTLMVLIVMTSGRIGSLTGNVIMPVLFRFGCITTFVFLGLVCFICLMLFVFFPKKAPGEF